MSRNTAKARENRSGSTTESSDIEVEFDVREDEEQSVKLTQTTELLLASGYFRVRIKGLTPFDKVVGGMVWCISTCSYDIDVDLFFQENLTIGQKISLTEKIVGALKRMKCPHRIEPHQIQGLDFIHIYPVVQWLVKRAIETREEMGDYIRAYAVSQFNKYRLLPEDALLNQTKERALNTVSLVKHAYRPQRKYRRHDADKLSDEEIRVQSTLLEYGRRYGLSRTSGGEDTSQKKITEAEREMEERTREEEEECINALMKGMSLTGSKEGKVTANSVGSIVRIQSEQIQQMAATYAEKQTKLGHLDRSVSATQQHHRLSNALKRQIEQQTHLSNEAEQKHNLLKQEYDEKKAKLLEVIEVGEKYKEALEEIEKLEEESNQREILDKLRYLVAQNESLKKQEAEFRESCKQEKDRLQGLIDDLKKEKGFKVDNDQEHSELVEQEYQSNREKLQKIRLLLARRNREIAALQRKIDDVPSRAELSQYQCRFVELYNQVSSKHKETKQFFTLYNTLDDTKLYLNKEVNLLNSISDTFEQAMSSQNQKEQFLKQFEQIVEGVKQNRTKVERRKQEMKMKRDGLNDKLMELVDKQRLYFKTVKDFQEECRKNEILLTRIENSN